MRHQAGHHHRSDGMELERKGSDDPEVAAAAPQRPEQIRVLTLGGSQQLSIRRHYLRFEQIVAGQPVATAQPAKAAS